MARGPQGCDRRNAGDAKGLPMLREIVTIKEELCDGCGLCVPACEEGALEIVDGKARLVSDRLCDGIGACLGHCPQDAIRVERREGEAFDEAAVGPGNYVFRVGRKDTVSRQVVPLDFEYIAAGHIHRYQILPHPRDEMLDEALNHRWVHGWKVQRMIQPLGYGVELTYHSTMTPHNIILLVTDQLGPVAACAWMACMVIGIKKTKWKYGFLALILFGVFQPFVWTEMAPYMWTMAGAATVSVRSSYIFRGNYATA